jgi:hypothetical protein
MSGSLSSRLASGCLALVVSSIAAITGTPAAEAPGSAGDASRMRFAVSAEGPAETCGGKCRTLISATGMITADTPRQFLAFVRDNALQAAPGTRAAAPGAQATTVVLESDGGSVLGALDLGRAIRRVGFATTVGRVVEHRGKNGTKYGEVNSRADCQSMCTFVLLGGVQREVPAEARVLVHQIWLGDRREDAVAANYSAEDLVVVQRDIGSIMQYTVEMGGDIELVALSLKVPPWEPMRALTRDELRRTRLDLAVEMAAVSAASRTAAGPSIADDDAQWAPINGRGWIPLTRAGQPVLARTHPLTFEGERIGSFDLYLACGAAPETFALTYREIRTGPADRGLPRSITQVALLIDDQLQALKITSSDKRPRRGEMESIASAVLPARLVRALASDTPASMTLETDSIGNPRTMIRVGNAGFGHSFRDFEKGCREPQRVRADTRAQAP